MIQLVLYGGGLGDPVLQGMIAVRKDMVLILKALCLDSLIGKKAEYTVTGDQDDD